MCCQMVCGSAAGNVTCGIRNSATSSALTLCHGIACQVATLLEEYFSSGDLGEAAGELADMGEPELQHFFVKRAVTAALDKHNREREMTSVLLSSLYSEVRLG